MRNVSAQVLSLSHLIFFSPLEVEAAWGCKQQEQPMASFGALVGERQGRVQQTSYCYMEKYAGMKDNRKRLWKILSLVANHLFMIIKSTVNLHLTILMCTKTEGMCIGYVKVYGTSSHIHHEVNGVFSSAVELWDPLMRIYRKRCDARCITGRARHTKCNVNPLILDTWLILRFSDGQFKQSSSGCLLWQTDTYLSDTQSNDCI